MADTLLDQIMVGVIEGESHRGENLTQPTASVEDRPTLPAENDKVVENRTKAVAEGPSFKEALDHVRRDRELHIIFF